LEILRRELDEAMLLCGCTKLSDIDGFAPATVRSSRQRSEDTDN